MEVGNRRFLDTASLGWHSLLLLLKDWKIGPEVLLRLVFFGWRMMGLFFMMDCLSTGAFVLETDLEYKAMINS